MAKKKRPTPRPATLEELTDSVVKLTNFMDRQSKQIGRIVRMQCDVGDLMEDLSQKVIDLIEGHNTGFKATEELIDGHNKIFERVQDLTREVASSITIFSTVMRATGQAALLDRAVAYDMERRAGPDQAPEGSTIIPIRPIQA